MAKNMKLRTKLLIVGVLLTTIPLITVAAIILRQNKKLINISSEATMNMAFADLDHMANAVFALCKSQQEVIQENVNSSLNVARDILLGSGDVYEADEMVAWNAINQYTKSASRVEIPKMMIGDAWLGQNTDMNITSPVVDKVQKLVGGTCTIFQRMNSTGDMLRVCSNVEKDDGTRAIGTYIPKLNPDGKPDQVVSTVLNGQTFRGRAFVVNEWYITAYEPILSKDKQVIGMLYVGVPQESVSSLRQSIMDTKVGKTGYVYVLDSQGYYVISKDGKRDGENIWDAKDDDGTYFIRKICTKALALKPGEFAEQKYPWKNAGDDVARNKIVRIAYFEPWDWIIGVGSYEDEFYEQRNQIIERVNKICQTSNASLGISLATALIGAVIVWFLVARSITGRINHVVVQLTEGTRQVAAASDQVSSASQSLAEGATEQAAGLEETSSSLEEMSSMTKQNADNAQQANTLASEARKAADTGTESMGRMSTAINDIQKSSDETAKIIKVIDEIAFQTNLLALNAAVEAARAGEAGKGFAVVAEEVRNLAMRSAEAAKNTANMIEESVKNSKNGVDIASEVGKVLEEIVQGIGKTTDLVGEIAAASAEQAQGIDQVNTAVAQMDKVTQQNAANAEESASASEELSAQAEQMTQIVEELIAIVGANRTGNTYKKTSSTKHRLNTSDHAYHQISGGINNKKSASGKMGISKTLTKKVGMSKDIPLDDDLSNDFDEFNT